MASPAARNDVRVVIVDDHVLVAQALAMALEREGYDVVRIDVPDSPGRPDGLVDEIAALDPGVVLLNLDLGPFGAGAPLVEPLAERGVDVVVLTGLTDRSRWGEVLAEGARTVISKSQPLDDVLATVHRIATGDQPADLAEHDDLVRRYHQQPTSHSEARERIDQLTARERQVLGMLMRGLPVRAIAAQGVVSEATVRTQVKSILGKLGVSSQLAAVGLAHQVGWHPPEDRPAQGAS